MLLMFAVDVGLWLVEWSTHMLLLLMALVCISLSFHPESVWAGVRAPLGALQGTLNHRISHVVIVPLSHFCTSVDFLY